MIFLPSHVPVGEMESKLMDAEITNDLVFDSNPQTTKTQSTNFAISGWLDVCPKHLFKKVWFNGRKGCFGRVVTFQRSSYFPLNQLCWWLDIFNILNTSSNKKKQTLWFSEPTECTTNPNHQFTIYTVVKVDG